MPLFTIYDVYGVILPMCTGDGSSWQMFLLVVGMTVALVALVVIAVWVVTLQRRTFLLSLSVVLNLLLNWGLKSIIRQPRPEPPCLESFGMPSKTVQFAAGLAIFLLLDGLTWRLHVCPLPHTCRWHLKLPFPIWTFALVTTWTVFVAISRVTLGYNTTAQVLVGVLVGVLFIMLYYLAITLLKYFIYGRRRLKKRVESEENRPSFIFLS